MNIYSLTKDIFNVIIEYLNYIEILALKKTLKFFDENIKINEEFTINYIKKIFAKYSIKYENLIKRMTKHSFLFGGMLLGILNKTIDNESDLDIIHYRMAWGKIFRVDSITIKTGEENKFSRTLNYHSNRYSGCIGEISYPFDLIKLDGSSDDNKIYQHITTLYNPKCMFKYMNENCDFDFTKVLFDGKKIYIKNLNSLIKKTTNFDVNKRFKIDFRNRLKLCSNIWQDDLWTYVSSRMHERIIKYQQKGYTILNNGIFNTVESVINIINNYNLEFNQFEQKKNKDDYWIIKKYYDNSLTGFMYQIEAKRHQRENRFFTSKSFKKYSINKKNIDKIFYDEHKIKIKIIPNNYLYKYGIDINNYILTKSKDKKISYLLQDLN